MDARFARSDALQREWDELRAEPVRTDAVQARMAAITAEMGDVLRETRALIPDAREPEQYSARGLHVVVRTYDSSDEEGEVAVVGFSELGLEGEEEEEEEGEDGEEEVVDTKDLRAMMGGGGEVIEVDGRKNVSLGERLRGVMGRRKAHVSPEMREELKLEESRLERETRRLRRKPEKTPEEDKESERIAARLRDIATLLGEDVAKDEANPTRQDVGENTKSGAVNASKSSFEVQRAQTSKMSSQRSRQSGLGSENDDDGDLLFAPASYDDDGYSSGDGGGKGKADGDVSESKKKKKGWGAFEAGVASLRSISRKLQERSNGAASDAPTSSPAALSPTDVRAHPKQRSGPGSPLSPGADAFANAALQVVRRGEKLNDVADESDKMAEGAEDMAAAVRALRKRQKGKQGLGGLF